MNKKRGSCLLPNLCASSSKNANKELKISGNTYRVSGVVLMLTDCELGRKSFDLPH